MFEAAIFDWDGTLADTREVIVVTFQRALAEIGCEATPEYIERRIGIGAAETFRAILRSANKSADEELVGQLIKRKIELEIELTPQVKLFEGAKELLSELHGKLKIGLASMNNRAVILHMIQANNLEKYFEVVLTAENVSHSKPNPEIFSKTAQSLKSQPSQCLVLEDSIFGVKAAKFAGMGCVAVTTGVYSMSELAAGKPDLIVKTLKDPKIASFILR